jgi:hypothetical protein
VTRRSSHRRLASSNSFISSSLNPPEKSKWIGGQRCPNTVQRSHFQLPILLRISPSMKKAYRDNLDWLNQYGASGWTPKTSQHWPCSWLRMPANPSPARCYQSTTILSKAS